MFSKPKPNTSEFIRVSKCRIKVVKNPNIFFFIHRTFVFKMLVNPN